MFRTGIKVGLMLLVATAVQAQDDDALREAQRLGQSLFELDRAMQAARAQGDEWRTFRKDRDVLGSVIEPQENGYRIVFVGQNRSGDWVGLYQSSIGRDGTVQEDMRRLDREPLSTAQIAQFEAGRRAENVQHTTCSKEYETLVIADTVNGADGWRAWLLPRSAFSDVLLLGGSYRADLSAAANTVSHFMPLAGGCSVLQVPENATSLSFVDEQNAQPNELHVYINYVTQLPLQISAGGRNWTIQNGRIQPGS